MQRHLGGAPRVRQGPRRIRGQAVVVPIAALVLSVGCSDGGTVPTPVTSILVEPDTSFVAVTLTRQLSATARAAGGTVISTAELHWASSDPTVADVSPSGLVTAAGDGAAVITATADGIIGRAVVFTRDLSGPWTITGTMRNDEMNWTCDSSHTTSFTQGADGGITGPTDGLTACQIAAGWIGEGGARDLTSGRFTGHAVRFQIGRCSYTGTSESPDRLSGTVQCTWPFYGSDVVTSGSWEANRVSP